MSVYYIVLKADLSIKRTIKKLKAGYSFSIHFNIQILASHAPIFFNGDEVPKIYRYSRIPQYPDSENGIFTLRIENDRPYKYISAVWRNS